MTVNERILSSAWAALRGELFAFETKPGYCLAAVRSVIEHALEWSSHTLYTDYLTERVETPSADSPLRWTRNPHARDLERSLRAQGMRVGRKEMLPGDLLFNYAAAPYHPTGWAQDFPGVPFPPVPVTIGHVGIYLGNEVFAENINPDYRPYGLTRGNLSITPLLEYEQHQGPVTSIIRFRPS